MEWLGRKQKTRHNADSLISQLREQVLVLVWVTLECSNTNVHTNMAFNQYFKSVRTSPRHLVALSTWKLAK